ncbi:MAG TPA: hypothetical protein VMU81_22905 [Acetobacteraceae bacterium]|nr:hypothetical protein [Acetobacteraceae bacterium]
MLFHSQPFVLGFLPACLAGCFLLGRFAGRTATLAWLLLASLFFYGWWNPPFLLLLLGSTAGNYVLGQHLLHLSRANRRHAARGWLTAGIAANLTLLAVFKYADFLLHIAAPDAPALGIFLPLAISFFTFQQIRLSRPFSRRPARQTAVVLENGGMGRGARSWCVPAGYSGSSNALCAFRRRDAVTKSMRLE